MNTEPVNIQHLIKNQNQSNNISQVPCNSSKSDLKLILKFGVYLPANHLMNLSYPTQYENS